ncbi:MAG: alpha/beta fold hydrolase [Actinomycetota bacterium]|nr:alpha/beta fold hydrolase [Actinomycetota bacterium]
MTSTVAKVNGISICYETFGPADGVPLLLVMGLGVQMIAWEDDFCRGLADRGYFAIRFDNRDVGESTHLHDAPPPDVLAALHRKDMSSASYTLEDMADDSVGLLDELGIERAHLVGVSMGGMIAQTLAIRHPGRVASLTSVMSTPAPAIGPPTREAMAALMQPPAESREQAIENSLRTADVIASPGFPRDDASIRDRAGRSYDRGFDPMGVGRQLLAIHASGDRSSALTGVTVPTVVVHGLDDPLVGVDGGRATAAAVPGSELVLIEGMAHDLPPGVWPRLYDAIDSAVRRASQP